MVSRARRNEKAGQQRTQARLTLVGAATVPAEQRVESSSGTGVPIARLEGGGDIAVSNDVARILDDICRERKQDLDAACAAVLRLATLLTSAGAAGPTSAGTGLAPRQRRKVEQYLKENLARPLRVRELAEQVSLSVSYFSRAFKRTFGETPHERMIRLRLEMAQSLLLNTNDPLSQIAVACGFADQPHLSKHFRRHTGLTPGNWRRWNAPSAKI